MFIRIRKNIEKSINKTTKNIGKNLNKTIKISLNKRLNKGIAMILTCTFFMYTSIAHADFSVTVKKQINIEKDQKVIAKIDGEQKLIEGLIKTTPHAEKPNTNIVDISWTAILDKSGRVNLSNVISTIDLDKKFLTRGTNILVKGTLPNNIKIKSEEEKAEKRNLPIANGSTNVNTSGGSSSNSPVVDTPQVGEIERAEYIKTYDGCPALYNQEKETILVFEQIYYINKDGSKKVTQPCTKVKDVTAKFKTCSNYDDYTLRETSIRKQAYFIEEEREYSAGGCVPEKVYKHDFNYTSCDAIVENEYYFKTGRIYYTNDVFEEVYLSDCILNPYDDEVKQKLMVDYDNCPVDHSGLESVLFGKYYYRDKENSKHVVSDCMRNYLSQIPHKVEFIKWENFDNDRYALRHQKEYILYPQGSQQYELQPNKPVYITGNEIDKIRYEYTPINIESRANEYPMVVLCKLKNGRLSTCDNKDNPKPNSSAKEIKYTYDSTCSGSGGNTEPCKLKAGRWEWTDYDKQCNVLYKRPDESTLNLNNWWTLIRSWDATPVNNAVCK